MTLPGFTADMSLYRTWQPTQGLERPSAGPIWYGATVLQVPNLCTWYAFCCRERLYPWCCGLVPRAAARQNEPTPSWIAASQRTDAISKLDGGGRRLQRSEHQPYRVRLPGSSPTRLWASAMPSSAPTHAFGLKPCGGCEKACRLCFTAGWRSLRGVLHGRTLMPDDRVTGGTSWSRQWRKGSPAVKREM